MLAEPTMGMNVEALPVTITRKAWPPPSYVSLRRMPIPLQKWNLCQASLLACRRSADGQCSFEQQACSIAIPGSDSLSTPATALVGAAVFDAASGVMRPYVLYRVSLDRFQVAQLDLASQCQVSSGHAGQSVAHYPSHDNSMSCN